MKNEGNHADAYLLNLTVEDPRWTGWLDRGRFDDVPPSERRTFNVTVKAPLVAVEGDRSNVTLTARSMMTNNTVRIAWISWVIVEPSVTLKCSQTQATVRSGELLEFVMEVVNIGDVDDQYTVEASLAAEDAGWEHGFNVTAISLQRGQSAMVKVWMKAPSQGIETASLFVKVRSTTDLSVWDGKRMQCSVERTWSATLETDIRDVPSEPGSPTTHGLTLFQRTNDLSPQKWQAEEYFSSSCGWDVDLPCGGFETIGNVDHAIPVLVTATELAAPGERIDILVVVRLKDGSGPMLQSNLSFRVVEHGDFWVSGPPGTMQVVPSKPVPFMMVVNNVGNVNDLLEVQTDAPDGWQVRCVDTAVWDGFLALAPWSTEELSFLLTVPMTTPAGIRILNISVSSSRGQVEVLMLLLDVQVRRALEMSVGSDLPLRVRPTSGDLTAVLYIRNSGNVPLLVNLAYSWDQRVLAVRFESDYVALVAGGHARLNLTVRALSDDPYGNYTISVRAMSTDKAIEVLYEISVVVIGPDLTVNGVVPLGDPVAGLPLPLNVTVSNVGMANADGSVLWVVDDMGEVVYGPVDVGSLGVGDSATVEIVITPRLGSRTYSAIVKYTGAPGEDDRAPNARAFTIDAALATDDGSGRHLPASFAMWVGLAAAIALLVVLRARVYQRRNREP